MGNRRRFLSQAARVGAIVAAPSAAAASSTGDTHPSDRRNGPVRIVGKREHKMEYNPDEIIFEEWFIGNALTEAYGRPRELFERRVIDRTALPSEENSVLPEHGADRIHEPLDTYVGTEGQWMRAEALPPSNSRSGAKAMGLFYSGPIWEFKQSSGGLYTTAAPINVVFDTDASLSQVESAINNNGYNYTGVCASTRYIVGGGEFVAQDASLGTQSYCGDSQYHIRLWNQSHFTTEVSHAASAHWDPFGHSCTFGNFDFESAESDMRSLWMKNTSADVHSEDPSNDEDWGGCKNSNDAMAAVIHW